VDGGAFSLVGGLAGQNGGLIASSFAFGDVTVGSNGLAGGLVGVNGGFNFSGQPGLIVDSHAAGDVSSAGINVGIGGLAGLNAPGSTILGSSAIGDVTATATVDKGGQGCSFSNSCQHVSAGGLVGENLGTIAFSSATGDVFVGSNGTAGGLVGFNSGIITSASAIGTVTGAPGTGGVNGEGDGGGTTLGGLVGVNQGLVSNSAAFGDVGSLNVANLQVGGLVGDNSGAILSSFAVGNVQASDNSMAGGLAASSSVNGFDCSGCMRGDGAPYFNTASIIDSHAFGSVTVAQRASRAA
jgi:hypothetical protein